MRLSWVRDWVCQGHFLIHWQKGSDNLADCFTKYHWPLHHRLMQQGYLLEFHTDTNVLRGCVDCPFRTFFRYNTIRPLILLSRYPSMKIQRNDDTCGL